MKNLKLTEITVRAIVVHDTVSGSYTVFSAEVNGPIVSADSLEEAKIKFKEAVKLAFATRNFRFFNQAVKATDHKKSELAKNITLSNSPEIQYIEAELKVAC